MILTDDEAPPNGYSNAKEEKVNFPTMTVMMVMMVVLVLVPWS